jgi:hypothetical protein
MEPITVRLNQKDYYQKSILGTGTIPSPLLYCLWIKQELTKKGIPVKIDNVSSLGLIPTEGTIEYYMDNVTEEIVVKWIPPKEERRTWTQNLAHKINNWRKTNEKGSHRSNGFPCIFGKPEASDPSNYRNRS